VWPTVEDRRERSRRRFFASDNVIREVDTELSRDRDKHLSPDELAWLAAESESVSPQVAPGLDRESSLAHAAQCSLCGPRLGALRSVQASLRSLVNSVTSERTSVCPTEDNWPRLAAGLVHDSEASRLLEHSADCDYCGRFLREATEDFAPELSEREIESIRQLPSTLPGWQRNIARKMAEVSGVPPVRVSTNAQTGRPRAAWSFSAWMRWAVPLAAAAVIAAAAVLWIGRSPSLSSTNQLVAQAYTTQRPVDLRFPGADYGPVKQERGESGPNRSRMDEPPELLEAETQIARGLASHPQDAGWLQAKARTDLFEGHYQSAIEALQQGEAIHPEDASVKIDLATAYFERAGTKSDSADQNADYCLALQFLNSVLSKNPDDLVALFNRAVVNQKLKKYSESIVDSQRYLRLDPSGEWAEAAKRQLADAQRGKVTE
jgi:tetratricopeptide (TPR) repeat protein